MTYFSKSELHKLSAICDQRLRASIAVAENDNASAMEKALANHEKEYMANLIAKLNRVAYGDDKRVGISSI